MKTVPIGNYKQTLGQMQAAMKKKMSEYDALSPADKCGEKGTELVEWLTGFLMEAIESMLEAVRSQYDDAQQERDTLTDLDPSERMPVDSSRITELTERMDDLEQLINELESMKVAIGRFEELHDRYCAKA